MHHITPLCKNSFHHNTAALLATDTYTGVVVRRPLREIREKQRSWEKLARTRPVRPGCGTCRAGTYRYRGIDIPRSPCCADNRAATVRESGPPRRKANLHRSLCVDTHVRVPCTLSVLTE